MKLTIPKDYVPMLVPEMMEQAISLLKEEFQESLADALNLRRVTAPLFVLSGTDINDDLNGVERAVSFPIKDLGDVRAEVVHSLAKWKRMKLGAYKMKPGYGLYTDMNAIRADEELDNLHSLYVDQWDWERTISPEDRNLDFLRSGGINLRLCPLAGANGILLLPSHHSDSSRESDVHPFRRPFAELPRSYSAGTGDGSDPQVRRGFSDRNRRPLGRREETRRPGSGLRRLEYADQTGMLRAERRPSPLEPGS